MSGAYDYLFKVLLTGPERAGKSALLQRFTDDMFTNQWMPTIGVEFKIKTVHVDDKVCKLQIWDTSGQEKFRTITVSYYRGAMVIFIVYDVTNTESFKKATTESFAECKKHAPDAFLFLVGTKIDLESKREVGTPQGEQFAVENEMQFMETSAAEGINVESVFKLATSK
jgi:Ras-related protein Rab-1A